MEATGCEQKLKQLEKKVRILTKKLQRSEADRTQLEEANERREVVLKSVIRELEESQSILTKRGNDLELALDKLKTLQVKLVESEKMSALGTLVAGIAHEINNPVGFIYGNVSYANDYVQDLLRLIELYQQHYPNAAPAISQAIAEIDLEYVQKDLGKLFASMESGAKRISTIVASLKTFSRLDEAELKTVDLHAGIDSAMVIMNHRCQPRSENPHGIQVIREYAQLPLVECYSGQLNQVFINILTNAIDALEEANQKRPPAEIIAHPNTIWIRTALTTKDQVKISIKDNGTGVPAAICSKLFDPFFTTKPVGKGTGLGLSISYQIVTAQHGGQLECHSTPGEGTEFIITLPLQAALRFNNLHVQTLTEQDSVSLN